MPPITEQDFSYLHLKDKLGIRPDLKEIKTFLKKLGDPQLKFPAIHIAGTNGKGSTASLLASIVNQTKIKTGLYTSPHLIHFKERFAVNGENPKDKKLKELADLIEKNEENRLTFFEFTTAMAFILFEQEKVDLAIVETGLGGRWDASICCRAELCIISTIAMDHQDFLGNKLEDIAFEKAGIIRAKTPLIVGRLEDKALNIIKKEAEKLKAPLKILGRDFHIHREDENNYNYKGRYKLSNLCPALKGRYQADNMALALAALESLEEIGTADFKFSEEIVKQGLKNHRWPARIQKLKDKPLVLLDGAHNVEAAEMLADYIKTIDKKPQTLLFGLLKDKDAEDILKILSPLFSHIIFTKTENLRSMEPEKLAAYSLKETSFEIIENPGKALEIAIKKTSEDRCLCITGSLYLAGKILSMQDLL